MIKQYVQTDPAIAKQIMGPNCIDLKEATSIFPSSRDYLEELDSVPFTPGTLFDCSEPKNQHILVPGLYRVGKYPLTIANMRNHFPEHRAFFGQWDGVINSIISSLVVNTCKARWYLLSKKSLELYDFQDYCLRQDLPKDDVRAEFLVVYIYAWLLMKRLRNESVFTGKPIYCVDTPNFGNYSVSLQCSEDSVAIRPFFIKQKKSTDVDYVPAIQPEEVNPVFQM